MTLPWTYDYPSLAQFFEDNPDGYDPCSHDPIELLADLLEEAIDEAKHESAAGTFNTLMQDGRRWKQFDPCVSYAANWAERRGADASALLVLLREHEPDAVALMRAATVVERIQSWRMNAEQEADGDNPQARYADIPDSMRLVLPVMFKAGAVPGTDVRMPKSDLAQEAGYGLDSLNKPLADAVRRGLLTSRSGPSGGYQLTPQGESLASKSDQR